MWKSSAPGKLILTGEHAVVYGKLAVAAAIDLKTSVTLKRHSVTNSEFKITVKGSSDVPRVLSWSEMLNCHETNLSGIVSSLIRSVGLEPGFWELSVESQIPVAAGLGSSASLAVATAACLLRASNQTFDLSAVNSLAYKAEELIHGRPSGIDNSVITYGGLVTYRQNTLKRLDDLGRFDLLIVDSQQEKSTKKSVSQVKKLTEKLPKTSAALMNLIDEISEDFLQAYTAGDFSSMKELIRINHSALNALGVSTPKLNGIVQKGEELGYSGKLTGGGSGGCCFFLIPKNENSSLALALKGFRLIPASICPHGVIST